VLPTESILERSTGNGFGVKEAVKSSVLEVEVDSRWSGDVKAAIDVKGAVEASVLEVEVEAAVEVKVKTAVGVKGVEVEVRQNEYCSLLEGDSGVDFLFCISIKLLN
jgi:hypothetical protein